MSFKSGSNKRRSSVSVKQSRPSISIINNVDNTMTPTILETLSTPQRTDTSKHSLAKLAKSFANKRAEKRSKDSWSLLIKSALNLQLGKIPLLLAVEAGNQSMVRELLSGQTAEQLKVSTINVMITT